MTSSFFCLFPCSAFSHVFWWQWCFARSLIADKRHGHAVPHRAGRVCTLPAEAPTDKTGECVALAGSTCATVAAQLTRRYGFLQMHLHRQAVALWRVRPCQHVTAPSLIA